MISLVYLLYTSRTDVVSVFRGFFIYSYVMYAYPIFKGHFYQQNFVANSTERIFHNYNYLTIQNLSRHNGLFTHAIIFFLCITLNIKRELVKIDL